VIRALIIGIATVAPAAVFVGGGSGTAGVRAGLSAAGTNRPPASGFTARVDNPWFPLVPGTRFAYTGVKDGAPSRDVVMVTRRTTVIDGVRCLVVEDRLYLRGRLGERTTDWYAQDRQGNVWYFGEDTAEIGRDDRVTSREGTWKAGVDGAQPGIFMPAHPRAGQTFRQELYEGHAEDHFQVIGVFRGVGAVRGAERVLLTKEWTPLEPGKIDHKMYVRGIGTVLEQTHKGGDERAELVSVGRGR
jgi:hypothetical protein